MFRVLISDACDEVLTRAASEFLKDFHLCKDFKLRAVSHGEIEKLAEEGAIEKSFYDYGSGPEASFWVSPSKFGMILEEGAWKWPKSIDRVREAYSDFCNGWRACRKAMK